MTQPLEVVILGPGETRGKFDRQLKVGGAETGGAFTFRVNDSMPPGRWVPEHIHAQAEEVWYVLEGTLTFRIAGREVDAPKGSFILVPRGTAHGFGNRSASAAAYANIFSPAGMEGFFEEWAELRVTTPSSQESFSGVEPAVYEALQRKYQIEVVTT